MEERQLQIEVPLLYDLYVPEGLRDAPADSPRSLLLCLHGYGQSKESMMRLARKVNEEDWLIAAAQGPHGFVHSRADGSQRTGFNWGARYRHDDAVEVHHRAVRAVVEDVRRDHAIHPEGIFLMGFSQPVSFNYRFVFTQPHLFRGVIGLCGGVPGDRGRRTYSPARTEVLHVATADDEFYPPELVETFPGWLEALCPSVRFEILEGGHRVPDAGWGLVEGWIKERLPA